MEVRAPETPLARAMRFPHFGLINSDTEVDAPGAAHDGVTHFTPLETYSRPNDTPEEVRAQRKQGRFYLETLKGSRPFALLDPKADIVFLQDPPRQRNPWEGDVVSSLATLVRWLDGAVLQNLRSLAIPYYTWHKSRILGILHLLLEFKELEELYVSFLGGVPGVGGSMGGWADEEAVVELGGHVTEVGEEVRGDVEGLKRKFPEWQKPRVQIVKHRGFLTKELDG
jgi:hypothetical protein